MNSSEIIVVIFVVEVVLKNVAQGLAEYWCGPEAAWNIMDALIILASLAETGIDLYAQAVPQRNPFERVDLWRF